MVARTKNPPVVLDPNPDIGGTSPGLEVTPHGASSPGTGAAPLSPARVVVHTAITAVNQAIAVTAAIVRTPVAGAGRSGRVPKSVAAVLPDVVRVLRSRPDLASGATLDAIDEATALAADLRELDTRTTALQVAIHTTGGLTLTDAWTHARPIYAAAKFKARKDNALAAQIAPLSDALRSGARTASTQRGAEAAQTKLDAAQRRAAAAAHKAALAQQQADLAKMAETLATAKRAAAVGNVPASPAAPASPAPAAPASPPR